MKKNDKKHSKKYKILNGIGSVTLVVLGAIGLTHVIKEVRK